MNIRLVEREPVTVACMRYTGPYGENIAPFWRQTVYNWLLVDGLLGRARYGISLDNPAITEPALCRYDAGVVVASDYVAAGAIHKSTLAGGLYAVYDFEGTPEQIGQAWHRLMAEWLPTSGFQLDNRPPFEHVAADAAHDPQTGVFRCEICIPVAPC